MLDKLHQLIKENPSLFKSLKILNKISFKAHQNQNKMNIYKRTLF